MFVKKKRVGLATMNADENFVTLYNILTSTM